MVDMVCPKGKGGRFLGYE